MSAVDALSRFNAVSLSNASPANASLSNAGLSNRGLSNASLSNTTGAASPKKLRRVAQQFEAMFMAEMLRMAHPKSAATGLFAAGFGEQTWQTFMDQALGQAVAAQGHTGLTSIIEKALETAQQKGTSS